MKIIVLTLCLLTGLQNLAQTNHTIDEKWQGNWVAADTGIQITGNELVRLYKDENSRTRSSFDKDRFEWIDSLLRSSKKSIEGWIYSGYTSMRLYHKNEQKGETTVETVEYKYIKLELLNAQTLRLSVSKRFLVKMENQRPAVLVTKGMKEQVGKGKWLYEVILKRVGG